MVLPFSCFCKKYRLPHFFAIIRTEVCKSLISDISVHTEALKVHLSRTLLLETKSYNYEFPARNELKNSWKCRRKKIIMTMIPQKRKKTWKQQWSGGSNQEFYVIHSELWFVNSALSKHYIMSIMSNRWLKGGNHTAYLPCGFQKSSLQKLIVILKWQV